MRRLLDLSYSYGDALPPFKGHPVFDYRLTDTHEQNRRTNAVVSFSIHMGTHLDPPYHYLEDGATIDEIPLDNFYLPGYIFKLRGQIPEYSPVRLEHLLPLYERHPADLTGRFVIVNTGWAETAYQTPDYYSKAPWLDTPVAEWFVAKKALIVGLDMPPDKLTPDLNTGKLEPGDAPVHRTLLGGGIQIAENLANLEKLDGNVPFDVVAFPLKIYRGCGGPARIVAIFNNAS